jgi:hypothetical protein
MDVSEHEKEQLFTVRSTFRNHSSVFNNQYNLYLIMSAKRT